MLINITMVGSTRVQVMAMLKDSGLQSQLTAARMVSGMSASLLAEIALRDGLAMLLNLMQYGHTDESLIAGERQRSQTSMMSAGGDLGKELLNSILQPKLEAAARDEDALELLQREANRAAILSEKTRTLRRMGAGGKGFGVETPSNPATPKKGSTKKSLFAGKNPGIGKSAKKWSAVAGVAVMNSAAGAVTRLLTQLSPLSDEIMEVRNSRLFWDSPAARGFTMRVVRCTLRLLRIARSSANQTHQHALPTFCPARVVLPINQAEGII